jgi:ABC-type ATPase involved in cell division
MKVLLDIKDDKAAFILELLNNFKFVKTELLSGHDAKIIENIKHAVVEINQVKSGKAVAQPLSSFLNEL